MTASKGPPLVLEEVDPANPIRRLTSFRMSVSPEPSGPARSPAGRMPGLLVVRAVAEIPSGDGRLCRAESPGLLVSPDFSKDVHWAYASELAVLKTALGKEGLE